MSLMNNYLGQSRSSRLGIPRINSIPTSTGATRTATGGEKLFGLSGGDWLGAGLSLLGGFMGDRSDRRAAREQARSNERISAGNQQVSREGIMADRAAGREGLRAGMQGDQDEYARTIMRNRAAIAPWGERYQGPRFTTANPDAPIYNPLMEEGHIFGQLGQPLAPPSGMTTPWNGG